MRDISKHCRFVKQALDPALRWLFGGERGVPYRTARISKGILGKRLRRSTPTRPKCSVNHSSIFVLANVGQVVIPVVCFATCLSFQAWEFLRHDLGPKTRARALFKSVRAGWVTVSGITFPEHTQRNTLSRDTWSFCTSQKRNELPTGRVEYPHIMQGKATFRTVSDDFYLLRP